MFTDFVDECRADMLQRTFTDDPESELAAAAEVGNIGMQTLESPRPIAVAA